MEEMFILRTSKCMRKQYTHYIIELKHSTLDFMYNKQMHTFRLKTGRHSSTYTDYFVPVHDYPRKVATTRKEKLCLCIDQ